MIRKGFTAAALALALLTACEREKTRVVTTFVSETEVTWAADSSRVELRGFTRAEELLTERGPLPEAVRALFPTYTEEYKYELYAVTTSIVEPLDNRLALVVDEEASLLGYEVDNLAGLAEGKRGCWLSGGATDEGNTYSWRTHLLHITRVVNGEDVDVWLPLSPFGLLYSCEVYRVE